MYGALQTMLLKCKVEVGTDYLKGSEMSRSFIYLRYGENFHVCWIKVQLKLNPRCGLVTWFPKGTSRKISVWRWSNFHALFQTRSLSRVCMKVQTWTSLQLSMTFRLAWTMAFKATELLRVGIRRCLGVGIRRSANLQNFPTLFQQMSVSRSTAWNLFQKAFLLP